jgi:hypothetical protein
VERDDAMDDFQLAELVQDLKAPLDVDSVAASDRFDRAVRTAIEFQQEVANLTDGP